MIVIDFKQRLVQEKAFLISLKRKMHGYFKGGSCSKGQSLSVKILHVVV